MIVTIDGPAGAGKSSTAQDLAHRLQFRFLDTGAMYRAVALAAIERQVPWDQPKALAQLAGRLAIQFEGDRVLLDGRDVTARIRDLDVTNAIHHVADNPDVRRRLVELQREAGKAGDVVTEGRDQGTLAFPEAECKIFLTASPEERARRRLRELQQRGMDVTLAELLDQQNARDRRDEAREVGKLAAARDAIVVVTDGMDREQVVAHLETLVRARMGRGP